MEVGRGWDSVVETRNFGICLRVYLFNEFGLWTFSELRKGREYGSIGIFEIENLVRS